MTRRVLAEVMSEYFVEDQARSPMEAIVGLVMDKTRPITPKSFSWEKVSDPNRLMKTYEFVSHHEMHTFVHEILTFQQEFGHHAKLTVNYPEVIIEVYTHDVNDITELDTEYARAADEIKMDVDHYSEEDVYEY